MILQELRNLYLAQASITAKVTQEAGTERLGVYAGQAPQGAKLDFVQLRKPGQDDSPTLDQTGGGIGATVIVECYATTYDRADKLANAVDDFFKDFKGTAGALTILAVVKQDESEDYEAPQDGKGQSRHVVELTYLVQFTNF